MEPRFNKSVIQGIFLWEKQLLSLLIIQKKKKKQYTVLLTTTKNAGGGGGLFCLYKLFFFNYNILEVAIVSAVKLTDINSKNIYI